MRTIILCPIALLALAAAVLADGMVKPPIEYRAEPYAGSLEETSQEAILIFHPGDAETSASQDLILKISVAGEVIERKVVGSYDLAILRVKQRGALNQWLFDQGFQPVADADDVLDFYREQGFVYACMKVSDAALAAGSTVELHPLRFTFDTGGCDGIYFPMRLTGLQNEPFDVNLYVFYDKWINDKLNEFGYTQRGFELKWRDYDSRRCTPNAGKLWASPADDAYLAPYAEDLPTVAALFGRLHPDNRYYLTNIQARQLDPKDVRRWPGALWLFPYYTNRKFVPYDARPGGAAHVVYDH
jgi:hypothetical protein